MNPARQALARKLLLGLAGVTTVTAVGVGVYKAVADRPPKFARTVAEDFPADAVGMVAFADPAHSLGLLDWAVSAQVRAELNAKLGFDPLVEQSWTELGFDLDAPIGGALVDLDHQVFALSLGLADADKAKKTIEDNSSKLGLSWQPREFAGVDGLWRDSPPTALLFRDDRLLLVASERNRNDDEVIDAAEELAELRRGDSLATTPGFRSVHRFEGDVLLFAYANLEPLTSNPMTMATLGRSEAESMAFALTSDGPDIHLISQTTMTEGAKYLGYVDNLSRPVKTLDRVSGPAYAGFHWIIDPQYFRDLLDELGGLGKDGVDEFDRETQRELGLSVRDDILPAWAGEFGLLWTGAGEDQWGGLVFAGVTDEAEAERLLALVWSRTDGERKTETDTGTLYHWGKRDPFAAKIHGGQLWFGLGNSRIEDVGGDGKPFRKTSESADVAAVVASGAIGVGFVDLIAIREALGEHPEAKRLLGRYANVIDELEALTMRMDVDGRTFTWSFTLHTRLDDAFDSLVKRLVSDLIADAGDEILEELGARRAGCAAAVDHMIELTKAEAQDPDATVEGMREAMLGLCEDGKFDPDCVLSAWSSEDVDRCVSK